MAGNLTLLKKRKGAGFTIPELLVVIGIILLMTALIVPSLRSGEQSLALDRAAHKAGQDVRRTQELALRAQSFTCLAGSISGYGVFFDQAVPSSYILFAECNGSNSYSQGIDGVVEQVEIESGVEIASVAPSSQTSMVFLPPTPQVFVNGGAAQDVRVSFRLTDGTGTPKVVLITKKGVVDVD